MKAPDKIYVPQHNIEAGNIKELDELIVAGSIEYIRKDYLLELLNEQKKQKRGIGMISWGMRTAIGQMIDKINNI